MEKSYIKRENVGASQYGEGGSYIQKSMSGTHGDNANKYFPLAEGYDIFTEIDSSLFTCNDTKQFELISKCLQYMREQLVQLSVMRESECALPKLSFSKDTDGTIIFNWVHSNFRAFFSFEDANGNYDAYCGIVAQMMEDAVSTQTSRLTQENYQTVIATIVQAVVENS